MGCCFIDGDPQSLDALTTACGCVRTVGLHVRGAVRTTKFHGGTV